MLRSVLLGLIVGMAVAVVSVDAAGPRPPEGQLIQGVSFTIAPTYLDPAEATQVIASAHFLYALHDALFQEQSAERDRTAREALLHRMQSLLHERVRHALLLERAALHGVGARVEEPAIGLVPLAPFAAPYEDMRLKRP